MSAVPESNSELSKEEVERGLKAIASKLEKYSWNIIGFIANLQKQNVYIEKEIVNNQEKMEIKKHPKKEMIFLGQEHISPFQRIKYLDENNRENIEVRKKIESNLKVKEGSPASEYFKTVSQLNRETVIEETFFIALNENVREPEFKCNFVKKVAELSVKIRKINYLATKLRELAIRHIETNHEFYVYSRKILFLFSEEGQKKLEHKIKEATRGYFEEYLKKRQKLVDEIKSLERKNNEITKIISEKNTLFFKKAKNEELPMESFKACTEELYALEEQRKQIYSAWMNSRELLRKLDFEKEHLKRAKEIKERIIEATHLEYITNVLHFKEEFFLLAYDFTILYQVFKKEKKELNVFLKIKDDIKKDIEEHVNDTFRMFSFQITLYEQEIKNSNNVITKNMFEIMKKKLEELKTALSGLQRCPPEEFKPELLKKSDEESKPQQDDVAQRTTQQPQETEERDLPEVDGVEVLVDIEPLETDTDILGTDAVTSEASALGACDMPFEAKLAEAKFVTDTSRTDAATLRACDVPLEPSAEPAEADATSSEASTGLSEMEFVANTPITDLAPSSKASARTKSVPPVLEPLEVPMKEEICAIDKLMCADMSRVNLAPSEANAELAEADAASDVALSETSAVPLRTDPVTSEVSAAPLRTDAVTSEASALGACDMLPKASVWLSKANTASGSVFITGPGMCDMPLKADAKLKVSAAPLLKSVWLSKANTASGSVFITGPRMCDMLSEANIKPLEADVMPDVAFSRTSAKLAETKAAPSRASNGLATSVVTHAKVLGTITDMPRTNAAPSETSARTESVPPVLEPLEVPMKEEICAIDKPITPEDTLRHSTTQTDISEDIKKIIEEIEILKQREEKSKKAIKENKRLRKELSQIRKNLENQQKKADESNAKSLKLLNERKLQNEQIMQQLVQQHDEEIKKLLLELSQIKEEASIKTTKELKITKELKGAEERIRLLESEVEEARLKKEELEKAKEQIIILELIKKDLEEKLEDSTQKIRWGERPELILLNTRTGEKFRKTDAISAYEEEIRLQDEEIFFLKERLEDITIKNEAKIEKLKNENERLKVEMEALKSKSFQKTAQATTTRLRTFLPMSTRINLRQITTT
jgi:hypothetical protein